MAFWLRSRLGVKDRGGEQTGEKVNSRCRYGCHDMERDVGGRFSEECVHEIYFYGCRIRDEPEGEEKASLDHDGT